ncbi:MAG: gliding motility-associated C-terminal domain-containing protein [Ferruginibacter sp.]
MQLNAGSAGASYLWQDGSSAATFTVSSTGLYHVTANIGRCNMADTISVSYIPVPKFTLGRDTFWCTGQQMVLAPTFNTIASLLWQDGSTALTYTATKAGLYSLQATNDCGLATDAVNIIPGSCIIQMPAAFSPNGDGINDVFKVKYPFTVQQFNMIIYNRYGEKIFETANINQGWDGSRKGQPQLMNSYTWMIRYTDTEKRQRQLQGMVVLLR